MHQNIKFKLLNKSKPSIQLRILQTRFRNKCSQIKVSEFSYQSASTQLFYPNLAITKTIHSQCEQLVTFERRTSAIKKSISNKLSTCNNIADRYGNHKIQRVTWTQAIQRSHSQYEQRATSIPCICYQLSIYNKFLINIKNYCSLHLKVFETPSIVNDKSLLWIVKIQYKEAIHQH